MESSFYSLRDISFTKYNVYHFWLYIFQRGIKCTRAQPKYILFSLENVKSQKCHRGKVGVHNNLWTQWTFTDNELQLNLGFKSENIVFTDVGFHLKSGFKKLFCSQMLVFTLNLASRKYCEHQFFLYITWLNVFGIRPFITVAKSKIYWQGVKSTASGLTLYT